MLPTLLLVALLGCGDKSPDPEDSASTATSTALQATATASPNIRTVVFVNWTHAGEGESWVEYGLDGDLSLSTPRQASSGTDEVVLLGLKATYTYSWRAVTELSDGTHLKSAVSTLDVGAPPSDLVPFSLAQSASGAQMADGYVMLSQIQGSGDSFVVILDGDADVVWYWPAAAGTMVVTSRPSRDGQSVLFAEYDIEQVEDVGVVRRISLDGRTTTETRTLQAHHDFYEREDGTLAWLSFELDDDLMLTSDVVLESPEGSNGSTPPTAVYSWFSNYPVTPWYICEHTDVWPSDPSYGEWTHTNSLMADASGDHYFIMSKFHDNLLKIRRDTGGIVWQMNGAYSDFTLDDGAPTWNGIGTSPLWSHGHMSQIWDGGMVVFNNGYHYPNETSAAVELAYDETTMTVTKVWEYREPQSKFTPLMGDIRKIGNNYLIAWSSLGRIDEISADQQVLWQAELGLGAVSGRIHFVHDIYNLSPPQ